MDSVTEVGAVLFGKRAEMLRLWFLKQDTGFSLGSAKTRRIRPIKHLEQVEAYDYLISLLVDYMITPLWSSG